MKNILFLLFVLLAMGSLPLLAQTDQIDENGRPFGTRPDKPTPTEETSPPPLKNGPEEDDADIPGTYEKQENAISVIDQLTEQMNGLQEELLEMQIENERLRQENQAVLQSVSGCCSAVSYGEVEASAFLMQNAPNPFQQDTRIRFFVPESAEEAQLSISNLKGELLKSYSIQQSGFGELLLENLNLSSGTYIYSLWLGKEMADAKLMILTE